MKQCARCNKNKELTEYYQVPQRYLGVSHLCVPCTKQYSRERKIISYGISLVEYESLLKEQKGACAICKQNRVRPQDQRMSIDHDHKTGQVRGILCMQCNTFLGKYEKFKKKAETYLKKGRVA